MYFDYFDNAFYINLDNRKERRDLFEKRVSNLNISINRFPAIIYNKSLENDKRSCFKIGCTLSHMSIIKIAKEKQYNNILIFEDDCIFINNFIEKINKCVKELKNYKWDLFYMGGEPNKKCFSISDNLSQCTNDGGMYGTHAYAINSSFYDRILKFNPIQNSSIDSLYLHQTNRNYILSKELLVTQDNLESDLWGGKINRNEQYKLAYDKYVE